MVLIPAKTWVRTKPRSVTCLLGSTVIVMAIRHPATTCGSITQMWILAYSLGGFALALGLANVLNLRLCSSLSLLLAASAQSVTKLSRKAIFRQRRPVKYLVSVVYGARASGFYELAQVTVLTSRDSKRVWIRLVVLLFEICYPSGANRLCGCGYSVGRA